MELKTQSDTLRRLAQKAEQLVDILNDFVIDNGIRVGAAAMNIGEAETFTQIIRNNLEGISINGDENVLDDIIAIYDKAIYAIDYELAKNSELQDGDVDKFNAATIESFNNVKKVLEESKGKTAEPLKTALDELVEEKATGEIDKEYGEMKVEEIEVEESSIRDEINSNTDSLNKFELATRNEREALEHTLKLSQEYFEVKNELNQIEKELANPNLSDEEKDKLENQKVEKENELVTIFKKFDDKYEKDDEYKQKEGESNRDYLNRMAIKEGRTADTQVKYMIILKQGDLKTKIESLKGEQVRIYNESTKKFEDIDIENYIDVTKDEELNNLSKKITSDRLANRDALKKQRNRLRELDEEKEKYTKTGAEMGTYGETGNQNLPVEPTKGIGFFEKFNRRREYYKDKGDNGFKAFFKGLFSKKEDRTIFEKEFIRASVSNETRKQFLADLEFAIKGGKGKDAAKREVKAKIFDNMNKNNKQNKGGREL